MPCLYSLQTNAHAKWSTRSRRFSHTERTVQLNKLLIEWLRLTDRLVGEEVLGSTPASASEPS